MTAPVGDRAGDLPSVDPAAEAALARAATAWEQYDAEHAIVHLSAALRALTAAGDVRRAAMVSMQLGELYSIALGNTVAGRAWFARAWRLVADEPPCLEQGWIAVAAMGCDVDDPAVLRDAAVLALERARRFGDVNLETKAMADAGLALVQLGELREGMAMLDEAMALACGPADDMEVASKSVCSFFTACSYAADFERASAWVGPLQRRGVIGQPTVPSAFISGHCESVRASLLVELGRWREAEEVLLRARAAVEAATGGPSWHPDIVLADLRIRQGRVAEAEELLLAKDQAMEALLPAARLHLARGDHRLAAAMARRGLHVIGSDRLRIVALLTVLVDAELASGAVDEALRIVEELEARVADLPVEPLRARAAAVRARVLVAAGRGPEAAAVLATTLHRLDVQRLPYLTASLLLQLAATSERLGDEPGACTHARSALRLLEQLDVVVSDADRAVIDRLCHGPRPSSPGAGTAAALTRTRDGWVVSCGGVLARVPDTKGMRYLAALLAAPGVERHALDLVDASEGAASVEGSSRRALDGQAGPLLDARARTEYRHRIEALRRRAEDDLASGDHAAAERAQEEIEALVGQLAAAFGIGGRARQAGSVAERARLNVTRAIRTAITRLLDVAPAARDLDRGIRTGLYCAYEPRAGDVRWIVQSEVNASARR